MPNKKQKSYKPEYSMTQQQRMVAFAKKSAKPEDLIDPVVPAAEDELVLSEAAEVYDLVEGPPAEEETLFEENPSELTPRELARFHYKKSLIELEKLSKVFPQLERSDQAAAVKLFDDAERTGCELSLAVFYKCAWHALDPADYKHNWHIDATAEQAERLITGETRRLIVNQPPRTGKSSLLSVVFPLWVWIQREKGPMSGPQVKFLCSSYGQSLSLKHSGDMRKIISSPWFQKHWGSRFRMLDDRNAVGFFENDKGGYRMATSVGAGLTGQGGDCVAEGTKVSTPGGYVPIEHLQVGDEVLGFDFSRDKVVTSRVLAARILVKSEFYELHTSSGHILRCTGNHPVFVPLVGFVAADKLGVGDRVLLETGSPFAIQPSLRQVRERVSEGAIHFPQGSSEGQSGCLLQREVQLGAPRSKKFSTPLRVMRREGEARFRLLFARMLRRRDEQAQGREEKSSKLPLSCLRAAIFKVYDLLLPEMRGQSSFATYVGQIKLQLRKIREVFEPVSGDGFAYPGAGSEQVCSLRPRGSKGYLRALADKKGVYEIGSSYPPYEREHARQSSGEFNSPVQEVPQETSPRGFEAIVSIRKHSGSEERFYDIQVESVCNFFADGILVHNCILIDDPANTQDVVSEADRAAVINWYTQALSTRLNDPKTGTMLLVMQRQHEQDLTGFIFTNEPEMWDHFVLRMRYESNPFFDYDPRGFDEEGEALEGQDLIDAEGTLLWPDRVPENEVQKLEKTLGTYGYLGQLQQRPTSRGGEIIRASDWKMFPPADQTEDWKRDGVVCWPPLDFIVASADLAFTEKQEADFSALTIWGLWHDRSGAPKIIVMHAWQDRLSFNPLITRIGNNCRKFKPDVLLIEAKAAGISAAQEIQRVYGAAEWSTILINPRGDKVSRAIAVQGLFEENLIYAPDRDWAQLLIDTCASFPKGKHDDLVDSTTQALRWMRDNGIIKRKEEFKRDVFLALPRPGDANLDLPPYDV